MTREYTNKIYDMVQEGLLTEETVMQACLCYMSEDDVKDMFEHNCFDE